LEEESKSEILDQIQGSLCDLICPKEIDELLEQSVITDEPVVQDARNGWRTANQPVVLTTMQG
jgi:hypothetical protein